MTFLFKNKRNEASSSFELTSSQKSQKECEDYLASCPSQPSEAFYDVYCIIDVCYTVIQLVLRYYQIIQSDSDTELGNIYYTEYRNILYFTLPQAKSVLGCKRREPAIHIRY